MKAAFYTLGCKVNQYESQAMSQLLKNNGFTIVSDNDEPDFIIINSCTVTAESDRKTRQTVRRFKRKNPNSIIVLTGCMPQAFPKKSEKLLDADIIIGNKDQNAFLKALLDYCHTKTRHINVSPHENGECYSTPPITSFSGRTRAFIKIEDGCNRFCSYCIIPTARGRVRSRSIDDIKLEAQQLAHNGFLEIVLIGINLSAYGSDLNLTLADAVKAVNEIEGISRIRLGSLEPDQISDSTLDYLISCEKFCPHFHLSLQSGCNKTLENMKRHYNKDFYRNLVKQIRLKFKNPSITTDIMVGFAGETHHDFSDSIEFVKEIGFAHAHVFAYSRRTGTKAAEYPNQITSAVKLERSKMMICDCKTREQEFLKLQVGTISNVLFETFEGNKNFGYTENYTKVFLESDQDLSGKIYPIKIVSVKNEICQAELV